MSAKDNTIEDIKEYIDIEYEKAKEIDLISYDLQLQIILYNEVKSLQKQLEEKDKIIDENFKGIKQLYNMLNRYKENHVICFDKDLWSLYQKMDKKLVEILERGKIC